MLLFLLSLENLEPHREIIAGTGFAAVAVHGACLGFLWPQKDQLHGGISVAARNDAAVQKPDRFFE